MSTLALPAAPSPTPHGVAWPFPHPRWLSTPLRVGRADLRPLDNGETEALDRVFAGLSESSRFDRFLTPVPHLTSAMRQALAAVDGERHLAWLASVDGTPAGIARYVITEPGTAEIAFEVADQFHGRGLGAVLLDVITTVASAKGVRRLQGTVLATNVRSLALLAAIGLRPTRTGGPVLECDGPFHLLSTPRVDRGQVLKRALSHQ